MIHRKPPQPPLVDDDTIARRDAAVRRALNTPPKPHKDMKKGRKRQNDLSTVSDEKRD